MSAALGIIGVVLGATGVVLLAIALTALGNAARFGVPAPLRHRRIRLAGALLVAVGVALVVAARLT